MASCTIVSWHRTWVNILFLTAYNNIIKARVLDGSIDCINTDMMIPVNPQQKATLCKDVLAIWMGLERVEVVGKLKDCFRQTICIFSASFRQSNVLLMGPQETPRDWLKLDNSPEDKPHSRVRQYYTRDAFQDQVVPEGKRELLFPSTHVLFPSAGWQANPRCSSNCSVWIVPGRRMEIQGKHLWKLRRPKHFLRATR